MLFVNQQHTFQVVLVQQRKLVVFDIIGGVYNMNKIYLLLMLLLLIHEIHSYIIRFRKCYRSNIVYGTNSHIDVPPLVELILLEASQVDSSKLIEAKSIIESDTKGRERSKYVWNSKNDALVSSFQYKLQSQDDSSIETMTLNERINELNIETYDKGVESTSAITTSTMTSSSIDDDNSITKKRGRPKKMKE